MVARTCDDTVVFTPHTFACNYCVLSIFAQSNRTEYVLSNSYFYDFFNIEI